MIIYKITNEINGKVYIGQTTQTLEKRWGGHLNKAKNNKFDCHFSNAIKLYGPQAFSKEVVDEVDTLELLNEREIYWIAYYDSFYNGYNETTGGDGYIRSEETKLKYSEAKMGEKHPNFGKHLSPETIDNMKKAAVGRAPTRECIEKSIEARKGKASPKKGVPMSEEQKEKLRQYTGEKTSQYGKHPSEETRKKQSEAAMGNKKGLGKVPSEEKKAKISAAIKEVWRIRKEKKALGLSE